MQIDSIVKDMVIGIRENLRLKNGAPSEGRVRLREE